MKHDMHLAPQPFGMIRSGRKTIELRLLDEKRKIIQVGDEIEFTNLKDRRQRCTVEVVALHPFASFQELYQHLPLLKCGYTEEDIGTASPSDMDQYYSPEAQARYGVVGIEVKLLQRNVGDLTASGKFLALVLRHQPQKIGITLDEHGWANVDLLLAGMRRRDPAFTRDLLEEIVRTDNKQRYSFNEDHTMIRANQGHSVQVDVELEECAPPKVLYHGTVEKFVPSILANGLIPKTRLYVHLSADYETAVSVGSRRGKPVVFRVDTEAMAQAGIPFWLSSNGVWLTKYVSPAYLTRLEEGHPPTRG